MFDSRLKSMILKLIFKANSKTVQRIEFKFFLTHFVLSSHSLFSLDWQPFEGNNTSEFRIKDVTTSSYFPRINIVMPRLPILKKKKLWTGINVYVINIYFDFKRGRRRRCLIEQNGLLHF